MKLLPHRPPFVWVNRIVICEPGEYILAKLEIDPELPLFKGHFPGYPVFPGVLTLEALAQAACCCIMADPERETTIGYLAGMDEVKLKEPVLPGDIIDLEARILKSNKRFCKAEVKARKGDKLVAEGIQRYILATEEVRNDYLEDAAVSTEDAARLAASPIVLP